jgi:hypothetical protein
LPEYALRIVAKGEKEGRSPEFSALHRVAVSARAYRAIKPLCRQHRPSPERNAKAQILLWLTEAKVEPAGGAALAGNSYRDAVIWLAKTQDSGRGLLTAWACLGSGCRKRAESTRTGVASRRTGVRAETHVHHNDGRTFKVGNGRIALPVPIADGP